MPRSACPCPDLPVCPAPSLVLLLVRYPRYFLQSQLSITIIKLACLIVYVMSLYSYIHVYSCVHTAYIISVLLCLYYMYTVIRCFAPWTYRVFRAHGQRKNSSHSGSRTPSSPQFDIFGRQKSAVRSRTLDFGGHGRFGLLLRRAAYDKVWVADIGILLILHRGQFRYSLPLRLQRTQTCCSAPGHHQVWKVVTDSR